MSKKKKLDPLIWTSGQARVGAILDWEDNPRQLTEKEREGLDASLDEFGYVEPVVLNLDGGLIGGHMRKYRMLEKGMITVDSIIDIRRPNRQLTPAEAARLALRLNKNTGSWDKDKLANWFDLDILFDVGFERFELGLHNDLLPGGSLGGSSGGVSSGRLSGGGGADAEMVKVEFLMERENRDKFFQAIADVKQKSPGIDTTEQAVVELVNIYFQHA